MMCHNKTGCDDFTFSWADPGFLERGFVCFNVWGFALLTLSHFS